MRERVREIFSERSKREIERVLKEREIFKRERVFRASESEIFKREIKRVLRERERER